MTSRNITIRSNLEATLAYLQPATTLIVICHGYQSSRTHPALVAIANGLNKNGYATVTFNFSRREAMNITHQVTDISDILSHFAKDYPHIILLAGSFGALSSAIATRLQKVNGLITINGFFGFHYLGKKNMRTFLAFKFLALIRPKYKRIWRFYKQEFKPAEIAVPVLVIHSETDTTVPIIQSETFFQQLKGPKQFARLHNADHDISANTDITKVITIISNWLKNNISV